MRPALPTHQGGSGPHQLRANGDTVAHDRGYYQTEPDVLRDAGAAKRRKSVMAAESGLWTSPAPPFSRFSTRRVRAKFHRRRDLQCLQLFSFLLMSRRNVTR